MRQRVEKQRRTVATEKRDIELALKSRSAELSADKLSGKVKNIGESADKSENSMLKLTKVASAIGAALATAQIKTYADAWTNVNNRLRAATSTQTEFLAAQRGVISIAQQAGVDIAGVADSYSRLAQSTTELGISQDRVLKVTKNVALALKAGGATAGEVSSIAVQLGQGLGSGALQGDELRSVLESSIPIAKALAKEFNTTTGELKTLGANGELTAARVVSALENMDEKALTFTKDITGGFTEVSNALTVYVGSVDESLNITESITGVLSSVAENIDVLISGVTNLAVLIGARYVGALTSAVISQTALAASSLRSSVQMNALGQVTARTTVAMNVGAVAAKGLGTALSVVGGPVGLALIAAAALYSFVDGADAAKQSAAEAADEVNILANSFSNLSKNRRGTLLNKTEAEMAALSKQLTDANNKLIQFRNFSDSPIKAQGIRQAEEQVRSINAQMDALAIKQAALIGSPDLSGGIDRGNINKPTGSTGETKSDTSSFDSLKARLELETQAIQAEAEVRRAFAEGQINQQQLDEELALQNVFFNYEARRVAILENEKLTAEQKAALIAELAQQEIDAEQLKQDQITSVTKKASDERTKLELLASNARIDNIRTGASATLSLLSAFGSQSSKTQKKFAIADAIVNIASGVAKALNNPYPANLGFAAQVAAQGAGLLATIKSASPGSSSNPSVPSTTPVTPAAPSVDNQSQDRIINITGLENFGPDDMIPITREQFENYISESEGVNIAINNGQSSAQRVGAI